MTDPTIQPPKPKIGMNRILAGVVAAWISSWFLTWCSLRGVDFKTFGIDSELVKSSITGSLVGFFIAPDTLFAGIRDFIIWLVDWYKSLRQAATEGKE